MNPQVAAGGNPNATANPTPFTVNLPSAGSFFIDSSGGPQPQLYTISGNNLQQFNINSYAQNYLAQNGIDSQALGSATGLQLGLGPSGTNNSQYNASLAAMYQKAQSLGIPISSRANNWTDVGFANIDLYGLGSNLINKNYDINLSSLPTQNIGDVQQAIGKLGGSYQSTIDPSFFTTAAGASQSVTMNTQPALPANAATIAAAQQAQNAQLAGLQGKNVVTTTDANGNITSATAVPLAAPQMTSIGSTITPPTGSGSGPTLPTPQGAQTAATYLGGISATLDSQNAQLSAAYQQQQQQYQKQIDALNQQQSDLQQLETAGMSGELSTTTAESQAKQAALDQEQQQYNDNYNANQALISEMDGLLQQGNQIVEDMQNTTGLASIMNPRISKTMSDVSARVGVIQAVLATRNDQIGNAQKQLASATDAITSIYSDQMNYYKSVVSFYEQQKQDNQGQIDTLSKDQQTYINAQIQQLQDQITNTQNTQSIIQKAMLDPNTALLYATAGVTLNDTPQQISQKLGIASYANELSTLSDTMAKQGYSSNPVPGVSPVTVVDSQGQAHNFYAATTPGTKIGVGGLTTTASAGATGGVVQSGKLVASQSDIDQGAQALKQSASQGAEADGKYADPTLYLQMYEHWVNSGGKGADFLKYYPFSTYINPANTWLSQSISDFNNQGSSDGAQTP